MPNSVKGALVMGAFATGAFPAINANAAPIEIPGIGTFDTPLSEQDASAVNTQVQAFTSGVLNPETNHFGGGLGVGGGAQLPGIAPPQFDLPGFGQQQGPGNIALEAARTKVGAQYSWGASGPYSFDCSGLVQWAYKQAGIDLPRTSFEQSHVGAPIAFENLAPGDIVITNGGGHVGIYAGDGKLLNAVQSGTPVSYTQLSEDQVVTARRIV
ncbi:MULTISPECIES: C40 family peptidase [Nocardia]|nr:MULTISPECIES: NlpC/P60 family protein [Nocardia]MCP9622082.1 NlpC/P60 family protein [Nocardia otitidiscaviarum]